MNSKDIDICVVSETHLKPEMPDAFINTPGYLDEMGTGRAWIADVKVEWLYLQGVTWT